MAYTFSNPSKHLILELLIISLFSGKILGQYTINGQIKGLDSGQCILAYNHFSGGLYPIDTSEVDSNGNIKFSKNKSLDAGIYEIVLPSKNKLITLIIAIEQQITFKVDTTNLIGSMDIRGSEDSRLFYQFQSYLKNKNQQIAQLKSENPTSNDLPKLENQRKEYYDKFLQTNKNTFLAEILTTADEPDIPENLKKNKDSELKVFNYYKYHFWDNFNFKDKRLKRTPFFKQKLDRYIKELTIQKEDSIINSVEILLTKIRNIPEKEYEEYIIRYMTNQYENPIIMGTEGVFVYMVEKYFLTKYINVIDSSTITLLKEKTHTLKPLLVDKIIPDIGVQNVKGEFSFIHELNKDFNIIFFYLPSCGHCKEAAPKLKAFYDSHKNESISIMPISTEESEADWLKFINDYQWHDFINGYGAVVSRNVNYSKDYDVKTTPTIYVIDKNHKIIARRIGINDIEPFYKLYRKHNK